MGRPKDGLQAGEGRFQKCWSEQGSKSRKDWIHTTIMPLVLVTHVAAVIVAITDPG